MGQRSCLFLFACLLLAFGAPAAASPATGSDLAAVAVSPGSVATFARLDQRCPTFSWGAAPGVRAWEIAVFAVDDPTEIAATDSVVLRRLPGSVTSWTASGGDCLAAGRYAWVVRARDGAGPGEWSMARLFEVATRPAGAEHELYALIERYLDRRSKREAAAGGARDEEPTAAAAGAGTRGSGLGGADFSIDSSGNVIGSSFAGDGSNLFGVDATTLGGQDTDFYHAWHNLTGVPTGFADGIDNDSDTLALLSCSNGEIAKKTAAGWECAGDNDTVAQLGCAADEVAQHDGAAWVCTPLTLDNLGAAVPAAPTHLRVGPEHRFPGMRRLSWNMPSLAGVASFVVYQSNLLITDANKSAAHGKITPTLYAAVELFPNSATQHFRVEAVNALGQPGPLSNSLLVNTTSHLAYIGDYDGLDQAGLYTVPAVSDGPKTRVSDPWVENYHWGWSPTGSQLAFASNQGAGSTLHRVYPGSPTPVRIDDPAAGGLFGYSWSWSPDGTRIAYRADPVNPAISWQLWTVPVSGGSAVQVNDPATTLVAEIPRPSWSPDGNRLLYGGSSGSGSVALLSALASGGGEIELSAAFPAGAAGVERAAWSPDGTRVAYLADQETADKRELWVVAASGDPRFKISQEMLPLGTVSRFSWSPDGTRIAYTADPGGDSVSKLYVTSPVGGPSLRLNEDLVAGGSVNQIEWSPDGKLIAYTADLTMDGVTELWVVPAVGGAGWRVSPTDSRGDPLPVTAAGETWSPDGDDLAFVADGELYVNSFDGSDLRKLSGSLVANGAVSFARWSPDGSRLAYQADQDTDTLQELYVVGINGGAQVKLNDLFGAGLEGVAGFSWSPLGN